MNTETLKTQAQDLLERGKALAADGQQRHVVFRNKSGASVLKTNMTMIVGVGLFLLITGFVSIPLLVIAIGIAMLFGIRVELPESEATVDDDSILVRMQERIQETKVDETAPTRVETVNNLS